MFKRGKIGSITTLSPAQKLGKWFTGFFSRVVFCVIASGILYLIFNYFIFNFINFLQENVMEAPPIAKNNTIFLISMIAVIALVDFYILKDKLTKR